MKECARKNLGAGIANGVLTDDVDGDGVVDLALGVGGHAGVIALVGLEHAPEVQRAVDLLHVLGKLILAVLVPLEAWRGRALSLARNLRAHNIPS